MSSLLKARTLGFLVLVSLAIIFLPWVFDGTGVNEREHMDMSIPSLPDMPEIVVNAPTREQLDKPLSEPASIKSETAQLVEKSTENAPQPTAKSSTAPTTPKLTLAEEKPALDQEGIPVAWTLQLASFQDKTNAEKLRVTLIKKGYKAYVRERDGLSKVFVGPDIQRTQIEKLRLELKKEFKLDGLILRFTTKAS